MIIGNRDFNIKDKTYIMGIINATPDSFSDGGEYNSPEQAIKRAEQMIKEGVDIIDLGAESTRPGGEKVDNDEEIRRLIPVLEALKKEFDIPVSVDTYKWETAKEAIGYGADIINDIWGLRFDDGEMAGVIADNDIPCVLMHNKRDGHAVVEDVIYGIDESIRIAKEHGIKEEKIILDPGIGFNKTYEENLAVLNDLKCLSRFNMPMLLGCSRKSVIGNALGLPVNERLEGTLATTALAVMAGYSFVRVHDIKENRRIVDMLEIIRNSQEEI